jgi:hypothetical protein
MCRAYWAATEKKVSSVAIVLSKGEFLPSLSSLEWRELDVKKFLSVEMDYLVNISKIYLSRKNYLGRNLKTGFFSIDELPSIVFCNLCEPLTNAHQRNLSLEKDKRNNLFFGHAHKRLAALFDNLLIPSIYLEDAEKLSLPSVKADIVDSDDFETNYNATMHNESVLFGLSETPPFLNNVSDRNDNETQEYYLSEQDGAVLDDDSKYDQRLIRMLAIVQRQLPKQESMSLEHMILDGFDSQELNRFCFETEKYTTPNGFLAANRLRKSLEQIVNNKELCDELQAQFLFTPSQQ